MGCYVHCALLFSEIKQQVTWFILDTASRTYTSNKYFLIKCRKAVIQTNSVQMNNCLNYYSVDT